MFGPRLTTVFASRWRAIWFAASICLLAYCSVPQKSAPPAANSDGTMAQKTTAPDANDFDLTKAANNDDVKRVQALLDQMQAAQ